MFQINFGIVSSLVACVSLPALALANASVPEIPAFGMTCESKNGWSVQIIPSATGQRAEITLFNAEGVSIGENDHAVEQSTRTRRNKIESRFVFSGFVEVFSVCDVL